LRFVSDEEGKDALAAIPGAIPNVCAEPSDWYIGTFTRGGDTGTHAGCTIANRLVSSFHSDGFGVSGYFNATLSSATSWTGTYNVFGGNMGDWSGTFANHFDGDGSQDTTATQGTATEGPSTEEQPPPCRARGPAGANPGCGPPPRCLSKEATIYPDEDDPFGVPIFGTPGNDVIVGTQAGELIAGGGGNDVICGRGGDDSLNGGGGADFLSGGAGDDRLIGGAGRDTLDGDTGNDRLRGGNHDDFLDGGGGGDDLDGATGEDTAQGSAGPDTIHYTPFDKHIDGGAGTDRCIPTERDFKGQVQVTDCERST
jgi:Ca2+-binding RTX toxin-like protein